MNTRTAGWTVAWVICVILAAAGTAIAAGGMDGNGRQPWNHHGPIPEQVTVLAPDKFLVGGSLNLTQVCGANTNESAFDQVSNFSRYRVTYVNCARSQTWNDNRARSTNYMHALQRLVRSPFYLGLLALTAVVLLLGTFVAAVTDMAESRRYERERQRDLDDRVLTAQDKEASLGAAYAKGEISEETWEQELNKIVGLLDKGKKKAELKQRKRPEARP